MARPEEKAVPQPAASPSAVLPNPAMMFPCLDAIETRSATLEANLVLQRPEPSYTAGATLNFHSREPLLLDWGGVLREYNIAYEAWGTMNADRSNVILLHTGLSASSHAHSTEKNPQPGWWRNSLAREGARYRQVPRHLHQRHRRLLAGPPVRSSIDPADGPDDTLRAFPS